ncbi:hypothetical protein [uncultured Mailhella sp.]|uniref:hypothetical protein n=1 Tax=uncultured Mailhella sp. TaxID=1981031 RepID=UPI0025E5B7C3|nr:hypothetical protein [uncultured Mailhella sp.]
MTNPTFIQASILVSEEELRNVINFIEQRGGFVRIDKSDVSTGNIHVSRHDKNMENKENDDIYHEYNMPFDRNDKEYKSESSCIYKVKYRDLRYLFARMPKVERHDIKGGNFNVNGFFAISGASRVINKLLVEDKIGYQEMIGYITQNTDVQKPKEKVDAHLKNMLYYSSKRIALQWGLCEVMNKEYDELPPCFRISVGGKLHTLMDDYGREAVSLLKKAEKIESPLLEALCMLSENR